MSSRKTFLLRLDPALWAELEGWAQDELRSANAQIEFILRQAVQKRKGTVNAGGAPRPDEGAKPPATGPAPEA
jgi:hypothetical protein